MVSRSPVDRPVARTTVCSSPWNPRSLLFHRYLSAFLPGTYQKNGNLFIYLIGLLMLESGAALGVLLGRQPCFLMGVLFKGEVIILISLIIGHFIIGSVF